MTFQIEITPVAEAQIDSAYSWFDNRDSAYADKWFRGLMNLMATLQEKHLQDE